MPGSDWTPFEKNRSYGHRDCRRGRGGLVHRLLAEAEDDSGQGAGGGEGSHCEWPRLCHVTSLMPSKYI